MSSSFCTCLRLALIVGLLTFPSVWFECNLKEMGADATEVTQRRAPKRKFEFRKLTRVVDDNGGNNGDDDEEDDDEDRLAYDKNDREWSTRRRARDDDDDDEDDESNFVKTVIRKSDQSEKAGKYVKLGRETSRVLAAKRNEEENQYTLFGTIYGWLSNSEPRPPPSPEPSNSIINVFKWFLDKIEKMSVLTEMPAPSIVVDDSFSSWTEYFNRWPFNALFEIGKVKTTVKESRHGEHGSATGRSDLTPVSQEYFESLLHTLPGFVVNASRIADIDCKQQMQIFHRQLRGNKLWALQMIDSTGKISSGVLRGSINQFGDFDTCTQIRTVVKVTPDIQMRIRGKYCLAHIETQAAVPQLKVPVHLAHGRDLWNSHLGNPSHFIPRYTISNWGVCIPHCCSADVVKEMIEENLRPYNVTGVEFFVEVDENDCYLQKDRRISKVMKEGNFTAAVSYLCALFMTMLAAFITDHWQDILLWFIRFCNDRFPKNEDSSEKPKEDQLEEEKEETDEPAEGDSLNSESPEEEKREDDTQAAEKSSDQADPVTYKFLLIEIFRSFSPSRTIRLLSSKDRIDSQFPVLHLLKIIITFMLYVCLKYLMIGHLPIMNRDKLVRTLDQPLSIVFRSPIFYADQLLLISGFLSGYSLSEEMEQRTYIGIFKRISAKFLRYLPTLFAIISFQAWIFPHLGSGPLWMNLVDENGRLCEKNMWRNLISMQNAIDFEESCFPISNQLALELQLYILGPLIVWLFYTDSDASFFIYGGIHATSVASRYFRTNLEHLSMTIFHGMNLSKFYRTANILFSSPINRASPYLIGIGAGIWRRTIVGQPEVTPAFAGIGWIASLLGLFWCFWYPSSGMSSNYVYNAGEAATFASWCPLVSGAAIVWIIFMLPTEENSILGTISKSSPITFLSRITFPMQLVTFLVVMHNTATVRDIGKYHITDLINLNEILTIVAISTIVAFLVDAPFQNIRDIIVEHLFVERVAIEVEEPMSGIENDQSEELSEGLSERITSDSPEPDLEVNPLEIESGPPELEPEPEPETETDLELSESTDAEDHLDNAAPEDLVEEEDKSEIPEEDEVKRRPGIEQLEEDLITILH